MIEGSLGNSISDGTGIEPDLDDGDSGFENDYEQVINNQIGDWDTLTDATTALGITGGQALSGLELDAVNYFCDLNPAACTGSDYDNLIGGDANVDHGEIWNPTCGPNTQWNDVSNCCVSIYSGSCV